MNKKLIEKIQKLLALATSPNEHEAKLAAAKAQELLVTHNLDMQQVEGYMAEYDRHDCDPQTRTAIDDYYVNHLLIRYFFVRVVHFRVRRGQMKFVLVGEKTNLQIAQYVRDFLKRSFPRLWLQYKAEHGAPERSRHSYYAGLEAGLSEQLEAKRAAVQSERGLVLVNDPNLKKALRNLIGPTQNSRGPDLSPDDAHAAALGHKAGLTIQINMGLESKSESGKFLK